MVIAETNKGIYELDHHGEKKTKIRYNEIYGHNEVIEITTLTSVKKANNEF